MLDTSAAKAAPAPKLVTYGHIYGSYDVRAVTRCHDFAPCGLFSCSICGPKLALLFEDFAARQGGATAFCAFRAGDLSVSPSSIWNSLLLDLHQVQPGLRFWGFLDSQGTDEEIVSGLFFGRVDDGIFDVYDSLFNEVSVCRVSVDDSPQYFFNRILRGSAWENPEAFDGFVECWSKAYDCQRWSMATLLNP